MDLNLRDWYSRGAPVEDRPHLLDNRYDYAEFIRIHRLILLVNDLGRHGTAHSIVPHMRIRTAPSRILTFGYAAEKLRFYPHSNVGRERLFSILGIKPQTAVPFTRYCNAGLVIRYDDTTLPYWGKIVG